MSKTKYYFVQIEEKSGGREHIFPIITRSRRKNTALHVDKIVRNWYEAEDDEVEETDDGYEFTYVDGILVSVYSTKEISKEHFSILKSYLSEL